MLRFIFSRASIACLAAALSLSMPLVPVSAQQVPPQTTDAQGGQALPPPTPLTPVQEMPGAAASEPAAAPMDSSPQAPEGAGPAARPDPGMPGGVAVDSRALPHDLSPWGMFLVADIVVQAVMVGLVIASVVTWTVWLAKSLELASARSRTRKALSLIDGEASLADSAAKLGDRRGVVPAFIDAARTELRLSNDGADKAGIKERVESRLDGLRTAAARQMNAGTGLLATIGSTAPFVGLFGTVWGIMNSFIGISEAQTTNLAVVAPGIAEALLATALGLAAAIPAVIIYNFFSRSIAGYRALVTDAAAEVMRQLSRDLDSPSSKRRKVQAAAE